MKIAMLLVSLSSLAGAHDLYLVPDGEKVCARIGERFPESMNSVDLRRIVRFALNGQELKPEVEEAGKQTCATVPAAGGVVEMQVAPVFIRIDGKHFQEYIQAEDLKGALRARAQDQDKEGRELYSRYSKTFIGNRGPTQAVTPMGHALEIVPQRAVGEVKTGETLPVKILFRGKPLANVQVGAVYAGYKSTNHEAAVVAQTDSGGRAQLKIDRPGWWCVRLIHMAPSGGDPDFDWRSYFATLTFEVTR